MIRINLIAAEKQAKKKPAALQSGQKMVIGCTLILVLSLGFIGWRFWALSRESAAVDAEIASAQQEVARLRSIIQQVQQFEQRKAQLQQRVSLIEQLRKSQTGPVHMLDQVSRAMPQMLWLTEMKQTGNDVQIDGKCTSPTAVSEFVSNLEASGYFHRSIEILSTQLDSTPAGPGGAAVELIKFSIKATFQTPESKPATPGAPTPAPAAPARTGG
ncbi:MAG TPA: PilN domain-containing protein [Vicinamibacterales bacterium]|nr:PilN domain-containing protein [Vicinamibacterales bacterium]